MKQYIIFYLFNFFTYFFLVDGYQLKKIFIKYKLHCRTMCVCASGTFYLYYYIVFYTMLHVFILFW